MYCLPKIHKQEIPYRPIVSSTNSPAHNLSVFLSKQLPLLINFKPKFTTKNSVSLCHDLQHLSIPDSSILFSFDVINLFTSIPPSDCLIILNNALSFSNAPDYIISNIFKLTKLALDQDFFQFDHIYFKQTSGLAMGSPLSPFLAEIFMNSLEESLSKSPHFKNIIFWRRYVDDVFGIYNGTSEELIDFKTHLNSLHPNIKFTLEIETNNSINFLDLNISKLQNKLKFNIYRKNTTSNRLIPFDSSTPFSHKLSAFRSFFNRLFKIPLDDSDFEEELNTIFYLAKSNKFPFHVVNNLYIKLRNHHNISKNTSLTVLNTTPTLYFSIPYLPFISDKVAAILKSHTSQIKLSFSTSHSKLKSLLCKPKDIIDPLQNHGIYKLNCPCGKFYIGRTIRNFNVRCKEHTSQITNFLKRGSHISSAFSNHIITEAHTHLIKNNFSPQILHRGGSVSLLNSLECLEILHHKHKFNDDLLNNITEYSNNSFLPYIVNNL